MRIALAQFNPTVGDLAGNLDRMARAAREAAARGAGVAVFPELSITGYPPRGLKVTTRAFGIGRRFPIAPRHSE